MTNCLEGPCHYLYDSEKWEIKWSGVEQLIKMNNSHSQKTERDEDASTGLSIFGKKEHKTSCMSVCMCVCVCGLVKDIACAVQSCLC